MCIFRLEDFNISVIKDPKDGKKGQESQRSSADLNPSNFSNSKRNLFDSA